MKSDSENIPVQLFDWLEKYNFTSLDSVQQAEVLAWFSADDYAELRQSILAIRSVKQKESGSSRVARKQDLLNRFDERHKKPAAAMLFLSRPIALWKVAAVLLLFSSGWMTHHFLKVKTPVPAAGIAAIDTIYVTREVMPALEKIYDTVYIRQQPVPSPLPKIQYNRKMEPVRETSQARMMPQDMNVLSIKELDSTPNRQKSNSIKDDSLLKKYPFVSIM
jgi:hypothetical protein